MDVSSIARAGVEMAAANTGSQLGMAILKSALDIEAQSAAVLMEALSDGARLPGHLGQNIDTTA
jgi:hypothetical protein